MVNGRKIAVEWRILNKIDAHRVLICFQIGAKIGNQFTLVFQVGIGFLLGAIRVPLHPANGSDTNIVILAFKIGIKYTVKKQTEVLHYSR